jgi:glutathione S-transferase
MHKLYYTTRSFTSESTALIPRIALEELALPYDVEAVELSPAPPDWYLDLNRHGQVPTLALDCGDGEAPVQVAPSAAIILALADTYPDAGLLPLSVRGRATCYACLFDMVEKLHTGYMQVFSPKRYSTDETHAKSIARTSCISISAYFASMDKLLAKQSFIAGTQYSICDIYFYVMSRWYVDISPSDGLTAFEAFVNVVAYCQKIEGRAAVRTSLQKDDIAPLSMLRITSEPKQRAIL